MIPAVVRAAVDAALPHADAEILLREPETHQSNQLFDVWLGDRHFIAKYYLKEDEWATAPVREHASLQMLEPLDIAPQPLFYEASVGPVVIYAYMDGRMWGRYQPSLDELDALAATMAQVHQLPTDGLWLARGSEFTPAQRVAWFHDLLDNYATWAAVEFPPGQNVVALCEPLIDQAGAALEALERTMPMRAFCRSDPRFANVITRTDGRLGFVDWEDAGLRDPALEIADMVLHTEQEDILTEAMFDAFLASYCWHVGIAPAGLAARVATYCRVFPIFWILIVMRYGVRLSQEGKLANWQVNEMPANLRLQRYLARGLTGAMFDFDASAFEDVRFFPTE